MYFNFLKGARQMTSMLVLSFVEKKFFPQILISFCFQNLKIVLSTFLRIERQPTQTMCTPKRGLNVGTALGHMLMQSTQRWADNRWCKKTPEPSLLHTNYRRCLSCALDNAVLFCLHVHIRLGNKTSFVFFTAFEFSDDFLNKMSTLYNLHINHFF